MYYGLREVRANFIPRVFFSPIYASFINVRNEDEVNTSAASEMTSGYRFWKKNILTNIIK